MAGSSLNPSPAPDRRDLELEAASRLSQLAPGPEIDDPVEHYHTYFITEVQKGAFDFAGSHDVATELEHNPYFQQIDNALVRFLTVHDNPEVPKNIREKWMEAVAKFMLIEIKLYNWSSGEMGQKEVDTAIAALVSPHQYRDGKPGIGRLEEWVQRQPILKREYDAWKKKNAVAEAKPHAEDTTRNRLQELKLETEDPVQYYLDQFVSRVRTGTLSFDGEHNNEAELEQNTAFDRLYTTLQKFLETYDNPELPTGLRGAWMKACVDFVIAEIANPWHRKTNANTISEYGADEIIKSLIIPGKINSETRRPGIGTFQEWVTNNPEWKAEYEKWEKAKQAAAEAAEKTRQAEVAANQSEAERLEAKRVAEQEASKTEAQRQQEKREELTKVKTALTTTVNELDATFLGFSTIVPTGLSTKVAAIKRDVDGMDNLEQESPLEARLGALQSEISAYKNLWSMSNNPDVLPAVRDKVFAEVKTGAKTPQEGWAELKKAETAKKAADERALAEDAPEGDQFIAKIDKWKPGPLRNFAKQLIGWAVKLTSYQFIGSFFRKYFSNKYLWEQNNDEEAHKAYNVEQEFRKFGIKRSVCVTLGDMPTKDVVTQLETSAETYAPNDPSGQQKLGWLANQLRAKGGDTSDASLFEFMSAPEWPVAVVYRTPGATPAAAPVAPPAVPAPGLALAGTASATAGAATADAAVTNLAGARGAESQAEAAPDAKAAAAQMEQQYIAAVNESLKPHIGQPAKDLTKESFVFNLPYLDNGIVQRTQCTISGNRFNIGTHTYNLKLPMGVKLQSISISGPPESGKATLVAGNFLLSDSKEIPLAKLLEHLEKLRAGPATYTMPLAGTTDTATFEKVA